MLPATGIVYMVVTFTGRHIKKLVMTTEPEKIIPSSQLGKISPIRVMRSLLEDIFLNFVLFILVVYYSYLNFLIWKIKFHDW